MLIVGIICMYTLQLIQTDFNYSLPLLNHGSMFEIKEKEKMLIAVL